MNRSRHDTLVYWAIWAFAISFVLIILATAIAAGGEALSTDETPSAPSADFRVSMKKAGPACVGVRAPGSALPENRNAVESILSRPARWSGSWCGFADKTILQRIATGVATMPQAAPRYPSAHFPGVTDLVLVGAGRLGARESNTAVTHPAHAAPGEFFILHSSFFLRTRGAHA